MEHMLRSECGGLIDDVVPRGGCEFVRDIAKQFPVKVFLRIAGAPSDRLDDLLELTERMTRGVPADRDAAGRELSDYVFGLVEERRSRPGEDLLGALIRGRVDERPLNDDEMRAMGMLLFLGGLDTVASTLAFIMLFLGRNPGHFRQLVEDPRIIGPAVEELVRTHSVASFQRGVRRDTEFLGIQFKKNDGLYFMTQLFGLDERQIDDPLRVDFSRRISPHLGFGAGPHRCVGSHLARTEVTVFLEEWVKRVSSFRIATNGEIETRGGHVWSPLRLPLAW
jgi:cytochrome P450